MRYSLLFAIAILFFTACKKDKYTTAPQIEFRSTNPNTAYSNLPCQFQAGPIVTLRVTDAEGDLGYIQSSDTAYVFIKNLMTNDIDSVRFPDIRSGAVKNFSADIDVNLCDYLSQSPRPSPKTDTLYFELYVRDFAKNVSNTIKITDPVYFITP
jgi:hypothetical protein